MQHSGTAENLGLLRRLVAEEADAAVARLAAQAERDLRAIDSDAAGEDSGLGNLWLEFAAQVQGEESVEWAFYEDTVRSTIAVALAELPRRIAVAIWLQTDPGSDWLYEHADADGADAPVFEQDLIDRIYDAVRTEAANCEEPALQHFLAHLNGDDYDDEDDPETEAEAR